MKITETFLIKKYLKNLTFRNKKSLELLDDVYYDFDKKLIFSTDYFEEGIHYLKNSEPKFFVKKIFRSSISDIICKGAQPYVYFLSLAINKTSEKWIMNFKKELNKESKKFKVFLGGGDTSKSFKNSINISFIGISKKKPILRSGAKKNDDIYITNYVGDSSIGLKIYQKKIDLGMSNIYFKKNYIEPNLPIKFSNFLYKFASSSTDLSDGLIKDLKNICIASKCGAIINFKSIPFSKPAEKAAKNNKIKLINIVSQGDDYQILFTAKSKFRKLILKIAKKTSTKVTMIGKISIGNVVKMTNEDKIINLSDIKQGYTHKF